ncbi:hypothetical protein CF336_g3094 [Tilletia laevis]|nr:hypothetical protein CF336_g3094 [Tilletia laevis]KAE8205700.1 hypothetical protein CF335_g2208 [Tilletia laevis]
MHFTICTVVFYIALFLSVSILQLTVDILPFQNNVADPIDRLPQPLVVPSQARAQDVNLPQPAIVPSQLRAPSPPENLLQAPVVPSQQGIRIHQKRPRVLPQNELNDLAHQLLHGPQPQVQARGHESDADQQQPGRSWWSRHAAKVDRILRQDPDPLRCTWRQNPCPYCNAILLEEESAGFCCQHGKTLEEPLPGLPPFLDSLELHPLAGRLSLQLNQAIHFAAQTYTKPRITFSSGPGAMAIQGTIFHRLLPADRHLSPLNMFLWNPDGQLQYAGNDMPADWIPQLREELFEVNPLTEQFQLLTDIHPEVESATLELREQGPANEVAGILHFGAPARRDPRSVYVHLRERDGAVRLTPDNPFYDALAYPLLFPHGTRTNLGRGKTIRKLARFYLLTEPRFQNFWRVSNLYALDVVCRMEEARLQFITDSIAAHHQHNRVAAEAHEVAELDPHEDDNPERTPNASLPSSFVGSRAYRAEHVADALALATRFRKPQGMVTVTTNPEWAELKSMLRSNAGQSATAVAALTVRVFNQRLQKFIARFKRLFGKLLYIIQIIEFQKRGLPHSHIVFAVDPELPVAAIDKIVSGEVPPETSPRLRELVLKYMPLSDLTYVDPNTHRVIYRRRQEQDRMIAQYCPALLLLWECHCHIDLAMSAHTFVYMFKYISKGPDYAHYRIRPDGENEPSVEQAAQAAADDYIQARYLSATEATWRIFGLHLTSKTPTVIRLGVHESQRNIARFQGQRGPGSNASSLLRYFLRPDHFAHLTYVEYFESVTFRRALDSEIAHPDTLPPHEHLEKTERGLTFRQQVVHRRISGKGVARIKSVRPSAGDVFYIRRILLQRPVSSWVDLRTSADGLIHATCREAAIHDGLVAQDDEPNQALHEATDMHQSPADLRFLLALLIYEGALNPRELWNNHKEALLRDFLPLIHPSLLQAPEPVQAAAEQAALDALDRLLSSFGLSNAAVGLPSASARPPMIEEELAFFAPLRHRLRQSAAERRSQFTAHQNQIRDEVLASIFYNPEVPHVRQHLIRNTSSKVAPVAEKQAAQRQASDPEFAAWVDSIGDDYTMQPVNLNDMFTSVMTEQAAVDFLFPLPALSNPSEAVKRCFLTPLNANVDAFNRMVTDRLPGIIECKYATDTIKGSDDAEQAQNEDVTAATSQTLALLAHPGVPDHDLHLKVGQVCSLMRNMSVEKGLVKHARVVITRINTASIGIRLLSTGATHALPRIVFEFTPIGSPFKLLRRQFALRAAYAATFHSCQGLTLDQSVIDCTIPIFAHGQRYACLSRTRRRHDVRTYLPADTSSTVNNIVYEEFVTLQME